MERTWMVVAVMVLWAGCPVFAASAEREAMIAEFSEAMGLSQIITQSQRQAQENISIQVEALVANLRQNGMSATSIRDLRETFEQVMEKVVYSWSADEAVRIYCTALAESMSDDDLRTSIAFYTSPEGQSSQRAVSQAASLMQAYIHESLQRATHSAMQEFMENARAIAERERTVRTYKVDAP